MKRSIKNGIYSIRFFAVILCILLFIASQVLAGDEKLDVQTYLPLLERNSIARKVLDVSYSFICRSEKEDGHLVFDTESGNYREEVKVYDTPDDADAYLFRVVMWNGEECVRWTRFVSKRPGFRALGQGVYEHPGQVSIWDQPSIKIPYFAEIFYDWFYQPFAKTVLQREPKLGSFAGDTITIDTASNKFEFSKKSGALDRLTYYNYTEDGQKGVGKIYGLSNHVERSGVWIPLNIIYTHYYKEKLAFKGEFSVDPKTLRLLDKVDASLFTVSFPAGCVVNDQIRKINYQVTTVDTLPNDVEAVKKTLEKMMEQAQEQKDAVEQKK